MDLLHQIRDGFPAHFLRDLCPHVQVDSRDKEVSARLDQSRYVPQASFCNRRL